MNINNKLKKIGFQKIDQHKLIHDWNNGLKFVSYKSLEQKAPKWEFTYLFNFSKEVKIWAIITKHTDLKIYVEKESG